MERIGMTVPGDWVHLDVSDRGRRNIREKLDRMAAAQAEDLDETTKRRVKHLLQGAVQAARKQNAVIAALWTAPAGENTLLAASLVVTVGPVTPRVGLLEDGSIDLADVTEEMTASLGSREEVVELDQVTLPVGDAVRVVRRDEGGPPEAERKTLSVQHFVPVPREPAMAVVTFTSPVTELSDRFVALFDRLTATLRFDDAAAPDAAGSPAPEGA